jgi:hypothetical protein
MAGQLRLFQEAHHRPDEHVGSVGERRQRGQQQHDHRHHDHDPEQAQRPLEATFQPWPGTLIWERPGRELPAGGRPGLGRPAPGSAHRSRPAPLLRRISHASLDSFPLVRHKNQHTGGAHRGLGCRGGGSAASGLAFDGSVAGFS